MRNGAGSVVRWGCDAFVRSRVRGDAVEGVVRGAGGEDFGFERGRRVAQNGCAGGVGDGRPVGR